MTKLALLDTSARPDAPEQTHVRNQQIEMARNGRSKEIGPAAVPLLLHRHEDPALRNIISQMAAETGKEAFVRQQQANIGGADSRPLLTVIRCPTLVGAQDRLIPRDRSEEIAAGTAGSRYVVVPECGHASTIEQPQFTTQVMVDWLRD